MGVAGYIFNKLTLKNLCNFEGKLSFSLLYAVVRVAVMNTTIFDGQPTDGIIQAMSKLIHFIPKQISLEKQELELRCAIVHY